VEPANDEGLARMNGVLSENFGTAGTAISQIVLARDGNNFVITGSTLITRINNAAADRFPVGTEITLVADSSGNLSVGSSTFIELSGTFSAAKERDSLKIKSHAPGLWFETGRNLLV